MYDMNSKDFDEDQYFKKIIKVCHIWISYFFPSLNCIFQEKTLKQLLEEESTLVNEVQRLDSDCQTLVYDHYDKFIAATDIVKQVLL